MKRIIESSEVHGLEALLGEKVLIFCLNYIYTGILVGVNSTFIELKDPAIVYETGPFTDKGYKDAQPLHTSTWNVQIGVIESFGVSK